MRLYRIGNLPSVDFANTVVTPDGPDPLRGFRPLLGLLVALGSLGRGEAARLGSLEQRDPRGCARVLARARALREGIRLALEARGAGRSVPARAIGPINAALAAGEGREALVAEGREWRRRVVPRREGADAVLAPVARDAARLIEEGPRVPVRRCGNPACRLYFYDVSRTGRRRWCSMALCGNRMKVAAHARRERAAT